MTNNDPETCHNVSNQDNCDLKLDEFNVLSYFLSCVTKSVLKDVLSKVVKLLEHSIIMNKSTNFKGWRSLFKSYKSRQSCNTIKYESWFQVFNSYSREFFFFPTLFKSDKGHDYISCKANINKQLKIFQVISSNWKDYDHRSNKEGVNSQEISYNTP